MANLKTGGIQAVPASLLALLPQKFLRIFEACRLATCEGLVRI